MAGYTRHAESRRGEASLGEEMLRVNLNDDPEKREWDDEQLKAIDLNPATTPLFDWLEKDDKVNYR